MLGIQFYRTAAGACPVEEFLDSLSAKQAQKVLWVLRAVRELPRVPQETEMRNDVEKYIDQRKRADKAFAKDFEVGYEQFKIGVMLREAREEAGVTQEGLARMTKTKKSAISRLENHAEDVRLSTVARVARALGKAVRVTLVEAS